MQKRWPLNPLDSVLANRPQTSACEFINRAEARQPQESPMTQEATPAVPSAPDLDAIRAEAAILERSRVSSINTLEN